MPEAKCHLLGKALRIIITEEKKEKEAKRVRNSERQVEIKKRKSLVISWPFFPVSIIREKNQRPKEGSHSQISDKVLFFFSAIKKFTSDYFFLVFP